MKEGQDSCMRLHRRLKDIFNELERMERNGRLPATDAPNKYAGVVGKALQYIEHYRGKKLVFRLIKHHTMMDELRRINEDIDSLFMILGLAGMDAMLGWRQQWETDQRAQREAMAVMVSNAAVVMRELQSTRAQLEAMMILKFETEQRKERQDGGTMQLMQSMMATVVRGSKTTVDKLPPWFLPSDELIIEPVAFAQGSFASVHYGVWGAGTKVVVKCFSTTDVVVDERTKQQIEAEMNLWYQLNHPNIIKMFGASHVSSPPFIACENAVNGDLSSFLCRSETNRQQTWRMLYQAALGLDYIHRKSVVHGDLKLNNILVGADGQAKLSDFGLSTVRTSAVLSMTSGGAVSLSSGLRWRAPECLRRSPTFASDVYSFAMCLIEAVSGKPPFGFLDDDTVRENIKNGTIPEKPNKMPEDAWGLIVSMTHMDSAKRVSLSHVLEKLKMLAMDEATTFPQTTPIAEGASPRDTKQATASNSIAFLLKGGISRK
ncbi:hypothetical protein PI124_g8192 [Phytophthora idaei]|nr:hypothetical protein PI124_g8192 [Phytophthora idaei]